MKDLKNICGSTFGAIRWKQNFSDAAAERIDTWAYRWLASMWENQLLVVSPNRNVAHYEGWSDGTHTRVKRKMREPLISATPVIAQKIEQELIDLKADRYLQRFSFGETFLGVIKAGVATTALSILKHQKRTRLLKSGLEQQNQKLSS
jgi:hypothetical protein